jgi:hypothetical protein
MAKRLSLKKMNLYHLGACLKTPDRNRATVNVFYPVGLARAVNLLRFIAPSSNAPAPFIFLNCAIEFDRFAVV